MNAISVKEYVNLEKERIKDLIKAQSLSLSLGIVQVGHVPSSDAYIKGKMKDANELGIKAVLFHYEEDISEEVLAREVVGLGKRKDIDGLIVQLPLPKHINEKAITSLVPSSKDIDGFGIDSPFTPCTPKGIVDYLSDLGFAFRGKNAVVIGRSSIVGKPLSRLLLSKDMNVTVLHSKTTKEDMAFYVAHADLICVAVGHKWLIDHTYNFKKDAVIIDVGINRGEDKHLYGDVEPNMPVYLQTPVPGGVGLLTRLSLLKNLLEAKTHGI